MREKKHSKYWNLNKKKKVAGTYGDVDVVSKEILVPDICFMDFHQLEIKDQK